MDEGFELYGNATWQIGTNIKCYIKKYKNTSTNRKAFTLEIVGSGEMYESTDDFKRISDSQGIFGDLWSDIKKSFKGPLIIPNGVTSIAGKFLMNSGVSSANSIRYYNILTISETVEHILDTAFYKSSIYEVHILGSGLKTIGESAFSTTNIQEVLLPNSVTTLYRNCFSNNQKLKKLVLSDNIEYIGDHAFDMCNLIESIELGNKIKYIGNYAFNYCYKIKSVFISDNIEYIGDFAFNNCKLLEKIRLPNNKIIKTKFNNENDYGNNMFYFVGTISAKTTIIGGYNSYFQFENDDASRINKVLALDYDFWDQRWHRKISFGGLVYVAHLGKWYQLGDYTSGLIPIAHNNQYRYLQVEEGYNKSQSPVFISHLGKWVQVKY